MQYFGLLRKQSWKIKISNILQKNKGNNTLKKQVFLPFFGFLYYAKFVT